MANAVIGALRVLLSVDSAAYEKGLGEAQKKLNRFSKDMSKLSAKFTDIGAAMTVGVTAPIAAFGVAAVQAAQQSADAFAQVEAALKSMGGASGKTSEELQAAAKNLQNIAAIDDDEILRKVTANLLTFGNIVGKTFDRAQVAIVDLATRLKMDLQSATLLVGKALNDPIKGMVSLGRAGIQLTDSQKALIKSLVAAGRTAEAQAIILGELERQFGGSAKAAADVNPYARLRVALGELSETIGAQIIPIIQPLVEGLTRMLQGFDRLNPAVAKFVVVGGIIAAAVGPALVAIGMLLSAVSSIAAFMAGPAMAGIAGAVAAAFGPVALAVAAVVGVFLLFRKQIIPVLQEWGRVVAETLGPKIGPLIEAAKDAFMGFVGLVAPLFQPNAPLGMAMGLFLDVATRIFKGVVSALASAVDVITNSLKALGALLRGDFSAMWGYLKDAAVAVLLGVVKAFAAMFPEVVSWVKKTWEGVKHWLVDKFVEVVKMVGEKVKAVAGFFKALWDAVVGHSYVPDMVDGIRDEFARLDEVMVRPAQKAAEKVDSTFRMLRDKMAEPFRVAMDVDGKSDGPKQVSVTREDGREAEKSGRWGGQMMSEEEVGRLREQFVSFGRSFVDAVRNGKLDEFFAEIANRFVDRLIDQGLNAIFDALGKSDAGGWMLSLGNVLGGLKLPGFATGGSFTVGGSGGIDSQLMMFRATPGEMVNVSHGNDNKRATNVFDMRGAVVTQDLLDQMNQIAAAGDAQVIGAVANARRSEQQAARYRVGRGAA